MIKINLYIIKIIACLFCISLQVYGADTNIKELKDQTKNLASTQELHRGNYDEPDTLDPQKAFAVPDYNILQDLYEGLTTYDAKGNIILGQAEDYQVSSDKKTYKFKLKSNLKWSNGTPLTAYDFEYGVKRSLDPKVASPNTNLLKVIKNAKLIIDGKASLTELGIKALDEEWLQIDLEYPAPFILGLLTHNTFMPVYKPNVDKYNDKFTSPNIYVTNGPFQLSDWVVNSHLTLVKNVNYINADEVALKKIYFYPINQPSIEMQRYRSGEIDITAKVPIERLTTIKQKYPKELKTSPMLAAYYYTFNVIKPPFKDNKLLRKALALAIDKDVIAEKILGNSRSATNHFVPFETANFFDEQPDKKLSRHERINLAKSYLLKSGFKSSSRNKIKLLYHTNESNKVIATAVASMWKKNLGIHTELINQEWKVFLKTRLERKETEIFREGWIASYNDPTAFLDLFLSDNPQNSSGYSNVNYDTLITQANFEQDLIARKKILREAESLLLDDVPVIPIYAPRSHHLIKPNVQNAHVNLFDVILDRYVYKTK